MVLMTACWSDTSDLLRSSSGDRCQKAVDGGSRTHVPSLSGGGNPPAVKTEITAHSPRPAPRCLTGQVQGGGWGFAL